MKKKLFLVCVSLVWTVALMAQQIAVVSESGTKVYRTLQEAIEGADPGSVIYLPGGGFPITDEVKITKKLTIYGIGHKSNNDNVDGVTTISGNLFFDKDSDGSALMGCYVTGTVHVGYDRNEVDDVLIRCNNISHVWVAGNCKGTNVNQNYLREGTNFNGAGGWVTNNVTKYVNSLDNGFIEYNLIFDRIGWDAINQCDNCSIRGNIDLTGHGYTGENNSFSNNMSWGSELQISMSGIEINDVFVNPADFTPLSDFHFKDEYTKYNGICGIYAGDGFSDEQLAPIPYIVRKIIPEHTDAEGKLNIKIRVKAGE